jgi:Penicillin amidase
VRGPLGPVWLRPRRAWCAGCGRTQVLLPASCVPRRRDQVERIGSALLANVPQPLPGLPGIPTDGGFGTVDASGHSARASDANSFMFGGGPVRRFVATMRPGQRSHAESSLPGGTSGQVGSDRYFTLLPAWLTNESYPQSLRASDLRRTFVDEVSYVPTP